MFKTNSSGRDSKEQSHELILDEHVECGCQCAPQAKYQCAGKFNDQTCKWDCNERRNSSKKVACANEPSTFWDTDECVCKRKSVVSRVIITVDPHCWRRNNMEFRASIIQLSFLKFCLPRMLHNSVNIPLCCHSALQEEVLLYEAAEESAREQASKHD